MAGRPAHSDPDDTMPSTDVLSTLKQQWGETAVGERVKTKEDTTRGHVHDRRTIEEPPQLLPKRAFVVQFRKGNGPGRFAGRVEHMPSAWAAHVGSMEELPAFITRILDEVR